MTDNDCRILAKACGLEWSEVYHCPVLGQVPLYKFRDFNLDPPFSTPDDWELVRVRVIIPNLREFRDSLFLYVTSVCRDTSSLEWWWTKTPEEKCQIAADFIKSRHDLFPWVTDFLREREK